MIVNIRVSIFTSILFGSVPANFFITNTPDHNQWSQNTDFKMFITSDITHWGRDKMAAIGSDNGLAPARRQAIIWTNDG